MSTVNSNSYLDGSGGTNATINGITPINIATANASDIGVGQTWQILDQNAERAAGVSYQNTTGKPIMVSIWAESPNLPDSRIQVSTDQTTWVSVGVTYGIYSPPCNFIVPDGFWYRIKDRGVTVRIWSELRS